MTNTPGSLEPVTVSLIGSPHDDIPAPGTVAVTPRPTQPNLLVNVVTPIVAIAVRFGNTFLVAFLGLLGGDQIVNVIPGQDLVLSAAKLAFCTALLGLGKDLITIFGRLENKYPLLTGSI